MIVYASLDDGTLYLESDIDEEMRNEKDCYTKYEIPDSITLTAKQCCGAYGAIVEILSRANLIRRI